ncbi:MAG: hypothetical protein A4E53_03564 [Pelotomaculum sp. PtaB.Bin104]|nr:MAG: hypothetical protein A4E53_03564 [Pelotomaculum sp. PtaB.Bin104]
MASLDLSTPFAIINANNIIQMLGLINPEKASAGFDTFNIKKRTQAKIAGKAGGITPKIHQIAVSDEIAKALEPTGLNP